MHLKKIYSTCSFNKPAILQKSKFVLKEIGSFFQAQNDFIDCFESLARKDKVGTDIEENKCTWLIMKCLEKADKKQKLILEKCYGQKCILLIFCVI